MKKFFLTISMALSMVLSAQTTLDTALNFNAKDYNGNIIRLYDVLAEDKFVFIYFFSSGCQPCHDYAPETIVAYEEFGCNTSNVFFMGIEKGGTDQNVEDFANEHNIEYQLVSGMNGGGNQIHIDWNIQATPTSVIIAPDRSIVDHQIHPPFADSLIVHLEQAGGIPSPCNVGTKELSTQDIHLILSPNPVSDILFITVKQPLEHQQIGIYSMDGRLVYEEKDISLYPGASKSINLSGLPGGVYSIALRNPGGNQVREILILQ